MLDELLKKINEEKKVAETDLDAVNPRIREHKKGQVRRAKEVLEDLYVQYKNELLKRSIFILVSGQNAQAFANIAEEDYKCFKVDGDEFYKSIVDELSPQLYEGKTVNSSVFEAMSNVMEDKMRDLDVVSYNSLMFQAKYQVTVDNKKDMIKVAKDAITDIIGGEVLGLDAIERVGRQAVNKGYASKMVPIVIYNDDVEFISKAAEQIKNLTTKVVVISNTETNDTESVGKALKQIAENA
jgi:hypothetical protein